MNTYVRVNFFNRVLTPRNPSARTIYKKTVSGESMCGTLYGGGARRPLPKSEWIEIAQTVGRSGSWNGTKPTGAVRGPRLRLDFASAKPLSLSGWLTLHNEERKKERFSTIISINYLAEASNNICYSNSERGILVVSFGFRRFDKLAWRRSTSSPYSNSSNAKSYGVLFYGAIPECALANYRMILRYCTE